MSRAPATLTELIYRAPAARLREIVRSRAAGIRGMPRIEDKLDLAQFLANALSSQHSIPEAIDSTSLAEIRTLIAIVAGGGEQTLDVLVEQAGEGSEDRLVEAVEGLERRGLAFWTRDGEPLRIHVPKAVRQATPLPPPLVNRLARALDHYESGALVRIAEKLGVDCRSGTPRGQRIGAIVQAVSDPERARAVLAGISAEAHAVAELLIDQGGYAALRDVADVVDPKQRSQVLSAGWSHYWAAGKARNGLEELLSRGLAVLDSSTEWSDWGVVLPIEVLVALTGRHPLTGFLPPPPEYSVVQAAGGVVHRHSTILRDVAYLLGYIGRSETVRTGTGNMHRNALKVLARGLSIAEPRYAEFVYSVARDADLIAPFGRKGQYEPTARAGSWLDLSADEQVRALFEAWRTRATWTERYNPTLADGKSYRSAEQAEGQREPVLNLLRQAAQHDPAAFVRLDDLADGVIYGWWGRYNLRIHRAADEAGEEVGSLLELLGRICGESLYWLGLAETLGGAGTAATDVRLSPRGRRLLTDEQGESEQPPETFIVQPNLEIYAPPDLPARILHRLFRLTEPAASGLLALTRESLRRALDRGETAEGVLQLLREHASNALPQNVEYLVREVGGRHGHIRVGQAGLFLQVTDPELLRELRATKGLRIHFRESLADTVALIAGDSVEAVLKQLRQAGYFPVAAEESSSEPEAAPRDHYHAPTCSTARRAQAAEIEGRIDWIAVEAADNITYPRDELDTEIERIYGRDAILKLLEEAISERTCVELEYQAEGGRSAQYLVEPTGVSGWLVAGRRRPRLENCMFNVRYVRWARSTGEPFAGAS